MTDVGSRNHIPKGLEKSKSVRTMEKVTAGKKPSAQRHKLTKDGFFIHKTILEALIEGTSATHCKYSTKIMLV